MLSLIRIPFPEDWKNLPKCKPISNLQRSSDQHKCTNQTHLSRNLHKNMAKHFSHLPVLTPKHISFTMMVNRLRNTSNVSISGTEQLSGYNVMWNTPSMKWFNNCWMQLLKLIKTICKNFAFFPPNAMPDVTSLFHLP